MFIKHILDKKEGDVEFIFDYHNHEHIPSLHDTELVSDMLDYHGVKITGKIVGVSPVDNLPIVSVCLPDLKKTKDVPISSGNYIEYLADNLEKNITYSEYLAENLEKNITYSEHIADIAKYSEYIADNIEKSIVSKEYFRK